MITKQIIHPSLAAAEAEVITLKAKIKHLFNAETLEYNDIAKHPTENKWATRYIIPEAGDPLNVREMWKIIKTYLNPNQIDKLVDITADWKNTDT